MNLYQKELILNSLKTQRELISCLHFLGKASIYELIREMKKPKTTLIDNLARLIKDKIVEKSRFNNGKKGRPLTIFKLVECAD